MKNKNQINEENKVTETVDGSIELEKIVGVVSSLNPSEVLLNSQVNDANLKSDESSDTSKADEEKPLIKCDDVYMKADLPNGGEPTAEEIEANKKKKKKRNILLAIFIPIVVIVLVVVVIIGLKLNMSKDGASTNTSTNTSSATSLTLRVGQSNNTEIYSYR